MLDGQGLAHQRCPLAQPVLVFLASSTAAAAQRQRLHARGDILMGKNYLLLNFTDYKSPSAHQSVTRTTPINTLQAAFQRRVAKKGGSFSIYNISDLLGRLRLEINKRPLGHHEIQGLLDPATIKRLLVEAPIRRSGDWSKLVTDCILADKFIFGAHGHKDDTDNVYCDHNRTFVRCGNLEGVAFLLNALLTLASNADPTITLVVCYAARAAQHQKHHVNEVLSEADIRSSLAFKLFVELSTLKPAIRLTARTGAMSASETGRNLLSETEEAIIASETRDEEFPGDRSEILIAETSAAIDEFEESLTKSSLPREVQRQILVRLDAWRAQGGYDPAVLDKLISDIHELDERHRPLGKSLLLVLSLIATGEDLASWHGRSEEIIARLRSRAQERRRLFQLSAAAEGKAAKYGKFVYQRESGRVVVSRWLKPEGGDYQLMQLMRLTP